MIWKDDKKLHYKWGYWFGKSVPVIGFLVFALIVAPLKEAFDWCARKFGYDHTPEWNDIVAGVIGAWEGMLFRPMRFRKNLDFPYPILRTKYFMPNFVAITLRPYCVIVREDKADSYVILNHERIHWIQQGKACIIWFYMRYVGEWICKGYKHISYEVEAYAHERDMAYVPQ